MSATKEQKQIVYRLFHVNRGRVSEALRAVLEDSEELGRIKAAIQDEADFRERGGQPPHREERTDATTLRINARLRARVEKLEALLRDLREELDQEADANDGTPNLAARLLGMIDGERGAAKEEKP